MEHTQAFMTEPGAGEGKRSAKCCVVARFGPRLRIGRIGNRPHYRSGYSERDVFDLRRCDAAFAQLPRSINAGMGEVITWIRLVKQPGQHPFGSQVFTDFTRNCAVTQVRL